MKTIILFLTTILTCMKVYNQNIIIVDSITKEPIPYVAIKSSNDGIYTNDKGTCSIQNLITDSIAVNHLQYKAKTLALSDFKDTVFLKPKLHKLKEVIIQQEKRKTKKIKKTRKSKAVVSFPLLKNVEIMMEIIPKENLVDKIIEQITIEYRTVNSKEVIKDNLKVAFRFNFYNLDGDEISSLIYSSDPITFKPRKKGEVTLDLQNTFIELVDSGIVIGVEFIGYLEKSKPVNSSNNNLISLVLTDKESKYYSAETFYSNPLKNNRELTSINKMRSSQLNKEFNDNLRIELIVSE